MGVIVTINGGSSSIKFAVFSADLTRRYQGQFSRIGLPGTQFETTDLASGQRELRTIESSDHAACVPFLTEWLAQTLKDAKPDAIGHRIVHGGPRYSEPTRVTPELMDALDALRLFAPEHLPAEIMLLRAFHDAYPTVPQVACFDTAFHRDLPREAQLLSIPRRYYDAGVRRYGFHGLSYQYLMRELERLAPDTARTGRVILAHLGNGASMTAVRAGKSVDTSMAFTPTAGLVMSTRSGDLDPGLVSYLAESEGLTAQAFYHLAHTQSGLLGISETSSDVRDLLTRAETDERAADALAIFCRTAKKFIGAYAAILGGLDTLVFTAGIGEHAPTLRTQICEGLEFLGIALDSAANAENAPIISPASSRVTVRVIPTDEESEIARQTQARLDELL